MKNEEFLKCVNFLLKENIEFDIESCMSRIYGYNFFKESARYGCLELCKWLVHKKGADPKFDSTAFTLAAENGHVEVCKFIETLDGICAWEESFTLAAKNGHVEVCKWLLTLKDVYPSGFYNRAFSTAAENGLLEICKLIFTLTTVCPSYVVYSFSAAAAKGYLKTCKWLINLEGVDPTNVYNYPFRYAAKNGHLEVCKWLITLAGVDPTADSNFALRNAVENGHLDVFKWLLTFEVVELSKELFEELIVLSDRNCHWEVSEYLSDVYEKRSRK